MEQEIESRIKKIERICFGKNKIALFGTGAVADMLYQAIENLNIPFTFFIVNDGQRKTAEFHNKKIYEISELNETVLDIYVIYAVNNQEKEVSLPVTEKFREKLLMEDYRIVLFVLLDRFFRDYFNKKHICIDNGILELGQCKIANPFKKDLNFELEWLAAMFDIILPSALSDYSYLREGPYEYGNVVMNHNDIVLDCGANVGAFSAVAASKGCKVYAFEPIPEVRVQLKETTKLYGEQIEIVPYALGYREGKEIFYLDDDYSAVSTMCKELRKNSLAKECTVNVTTLDEFVFKNQLPKVDFIKADIEGAERYMLEGAKQVLQTMQPKLAIATYHLPDDKECLEEIVRKINPNYEILHRWKTMYAYLPEG